jgi:hypothetical protein
MRWRILTLLMGLAWTGCALAQHAVAPSAPASAPAAAAAQEGNLPPDMTVPVMINGQGPFQFAIDSGSTTTLIASELAERLNLPGKGHVRAHAMSGIASLRTVGIETLQVGSTTHYDVQVAAVPRDNLGLDGLLGLNMVKNQRVTLDFVTRSIRIEPSVPPTKAEQKEERKEVDEIVVTAKLQHQQLIMTDADADGQKVWVIVDSGSESSVGNMRLMALLTKGVPPGAIKPVSLIDVIGRATDAQYTYVERLRVGGMSISPIPIAFADAHPFKLFGLLNRPSMLLGMETLQAFNRVDIDFATRKVTFKIAKGKLRPGRPPGF